MYNNMYYDPSLSAQQRMAYLQQQYPQYLPQQQPQPQPQMVQQTGFEIIPVTSEDEAKASPVDTVNDNPKFFFNRGKNEIYLKQFNRQTGGANFETFMLVQSNLNGGNGQNNINPYQENFNVINDKLDRICSMFEKDVEKVETKEKKGAKNAE